MFPMMAFFPFRSCDQARFALASVISGALNAYPVSASGFARRCGRSEQTG